MLSYFDLAYCVSTISRNISPDGRIYAVVLDCWQQAGFGLQSTEQDLIVHLVRPEEERKLASTVNSCDHPKKTAMLSIWNDNLKNRPLLHWLSSSRLEVMIPEGSQIKIFETSREGITVDFALEETNDQRQRRKNETSGETDDSYEQINNIHWKCLNINPFREAITGIFL
jgi:hypothetical protein